MVFQVVVWLVVVRTGATTKFEALLFQAVANLQDDLGRIVCHVISIHRDVQYLSIFDALDLGIIKRELVISRRIYVPLYLMLGWSHIPPLNEKTPSYIHSIKLLLCTLS